MKVVGIDIGTHSIKIVGLISSKKSNALVESFEYLLKPDANKDSQLEIIDILRSYMQQQDPHLTHYVLGVSQKRVSHRRLEFPFKERHNILKSIAFELEEEIPLSIDNAIFDAKITSFTENSAHVLASAAPKSLISEILQLCQDCGIHPHIISTEGMALANLFENWSEVPPEKKSRDLEVPKGLSIDVILHFGHSHTLCLFYKGHELIGLRNLSCGVEPISLAISSMYNIPPTEAQKELTHKGFILLDPEGATDDQKSFSKVIEKALLPMTQDLLLLLLEVKSEYNTNIGKISVCGGLSHLKNFAAFLTQYLELPIQQITPADPHILINSKEFNPNTGAIALGYAIEGLKKPRNPATNLLKNEFAQSSSSFKSLWEKWSYSAKLFLAALVVLYTYSSMKESISLELYDAVTDQTHKMAKSIAGVKKKRNIEKEIKKYIKKQSQKEKYKKLSTQLDKINSGLDVLNQFSQSAPNKKKFVMDLKKFSLKDELLIIEGTYPASQNIRLLEETLKNISKNKKWNKLNPTITAKPKERRFSYSLRVNRNTGAR